MTRRSLKLWRPWLVYLQYDISRFVADVKEGRWSSFQVYLVVLAENINNAGTGLFSHGQLKDVGSKFVWGGMVEPFVLELRKGDGGKGARTLRARTTRLEFILLLIK